MKRIINSTLAITAGVLFLSAVSSCKKEPSPADTPRQTSLPSGITTANGRLVFKDNSAFFAAMEYIDKSGDAARSSFLQQHAPGFTSFSRAMAAVPEDYSYSAAETELLSMPPSVQHLLNANGEVQVGDEVVWYSSGSKYYVPARDEAALRRVKQNPASAEKTSRYFVSSKPATGGTAGSSGSSIVPNWIALSNGADARHQREFWQYYPAAGNRKYVHEVGAYTDYYYVAPNTCGQATYNYYTGCYLYIKMEWRGRRWKPAGETRDISYNLTCQGSATVARGCGIVDNLGFIVSPSEVTTANSTHTYTMAAFGGYTVSNSGYYPIVWGINVEGTIYQHVVGDVMSNEWYNTGFPLW